MSNRALGLAALAVLIVVDVVLIALALRPAPTPDPAALPVTPPMETSTPAEAGGEATAEAPAEDFPAPGPARLVAVRPDGSALAALTGACDQASSSGLEIPTTGTTRPVVVPGAVMGRLTTMDSGDLELVATSADCTGELRFTEAAAQDEWTPEGSPQGVRYMFPGGPGIAMPSGPVPFPCEIASFAPDNQSAAVLCSDGAVLVADQSEWQSRGNLPAGRALSRISGGSGLVALATADDCSGLTVHRSDDGGTTWVRTSCIPAAASSGDPVGIGAQASTVVVVDGAGTAYRGDINGGEFTQGG